MDKTKAIYIQTDGQTTFIHIQHSIRCTRHVSTSFLLACLTDPHKTKHKRSEIFTLPMLCDE